MSYMVKINLEYDWLEELNLLFQTTEYCEKLYDSFAINREWFIICSVKLPKMNSYFLIKSRQHLQIEAVVKLIDSSTNILSVRDLQ